MKCGTGKTDCEGRGCLNLDANNIVLVHKMSEKISLDLLQGVPNFFCTFGSYSDPQKGTLCFNIEIKLILTTAFKFPIYQNKSSASIVSMFFYFILVSPEKNPQSFPLPPQSVYHFQCPSHEVLVSTVVLVQVSQPGADILE